MKGMREYIFHGKRKDNGEWVNGFYVCLNSKSHRIYNGCAETDCGDYYPEWFEVIPETVGQCTGVIDKNEKLIFEGDIVQLVDKNCDYSWEAVVVFGNPYGQYCWGWNFACIDKHPGCNTDILLWVEMEETGAECEVIGNIHDKPELLKGVE